MNFSFNYYKQLDDSEFYLCNPDGRELYSIAAYNRNVTLRFNDLSTIDFEVRYISSEQSHSTAEYYDLIETMRLVFVTQIGWFKIVSVSESDNGEEKYKSVQLESYQTVFKHRGFIAEEKVYKFYDPSDPFDELYNGDKAESMPSVVGQLYRQLGIDQDLEQGIRDPDSPYDTWTITYISPSLIYSGAGSTCRSFRENVTYGYDWMVNDVEDAFNIIFVFDFMNRAIHIKTVDEVTKRANLCLSFNNFMKNIKVNEDANDIVTVLSCNGDGIDITQVNPTGTNYIVDFSYYMDSVNHRWMSGKLIDELHIWQEEVDYYQQEYEALISELRSLYIANTESQEKLELASLHLTDLKNARDNQIISMNTGSSLSGIVIAETVKPGHLCLLKSSSYGFADEPFETDKKVTAYKTLPSFNASSQTWSFNSAGSYDTIENNYANGYVYFSDDPNRKSYCCMTGKAVVNVDAPEAEYVCGGFTRYIAYGDEVLQWINNWEALVDSMNQAIANNDDLIKDVNASVNEISSHLNILMYFSEDPDMLRELTCYWIEGEYTNENIAALEDTTPELSIDLAHELMESGKKELAKLSQPRYSFQLEANDILGQYEFKDQASEIELGTIITVEKEDGLWYYPALLEISFSLDNKDALNLTFANSLRLDDWGYTYADLISSASSTSRQVSANWQNFMSYTKDKETISGLIKNPLDTTLRASFANSVNQDFVIDDKGILGRRFKSEDKDGGFENEQLRLINNLLIFTDDNWKTAKTALGKLYLTDENGNLITTYGLAAESIIGNVILSEKLKVVNENGAISLDNDGIRIADKNGNLIFNANINGGLTVNGYATSGSVSELKGQLDFKISKDEYNQIISMINLSTDVITLDAKKLIISAGPFQLDADGYMHCTGGTIGGMTIKEQELSSEFLGSNSDLGETFNELLTIAPDYIRTRESYAKHYGATHIVRDKKVVLGNGFIHITNNTSGESNSSAPTIMVATINNVSYEIFVNPIDLSIGVREPDSPITSVDV